MNKKANITPEIAAALEEGRLQGLREAKQYIENIKEVFIPYIFRGLGGVAETNDDGWAKLDSKQVKMRDSFARGIGRLIDGTKNPEHVCEKGNGHCAICGKEKQK